MPIDGSNILGLLFFVGLACFALWQLYAKLRSYAHLQRHGRILWVTVVDRKTELHPIIINGRQILKGEDFLYVRWKDKEGENEQTLKIKAPGSYNPIGEMLPLRVSSDNFQAYRLDLKLLRSHFTPQQRLQPKRSNDYDNTIGTREDYEMPKTAYPLHLPEQK